MPEKTAPSILNWVRARADCSVRSVFDELIEGARGDAEEMNSLLGERSQMIFSTYRPSKRRFSVARVDDPITNISSSVDFELEANEIVVYHMSNSGNETLFRVGVTLNNEGQCRLKIKGQDEELEQWQVRRKALEPFLFGRS